MIESERGACADGILRCTPANPSNEAQAFAGTHDGPQHALGQCGLIGRETILNTNLSRAEARLLMCAASCAVQHVGNRTQCRPDPHKAPSLTRAIL
jgi:hypothetical protein